MALKFEVETLDGVDESVRSLYEEADGKFRLAVEDLPKFDDGKELKDALVKERDVSKSYKEQLKKIEDERNKIEEERAKEKGEFKSLYEKTQSELEQEREQARKFRTTIQQKDQDNDALQLASQLTKDMAKANLLKKEMLQFSRYTDEGVMYEIGGVQVEKQKVLDKIREDYPFLVDGSQATGGGANGGRGAGPQVKQITRDQFEGMSQKQRSDFSKTGGKVINN